MTQSDRPVINNSNFTLLTLFAVVSCIAAILAFTIPYIIVGRERARQQQCNYNIRALVLGFHNYESTYKVMPKAFQPHSQLSWTVALIPYLEASSLYTQISQDSGPYYSKNKNEPFGTDAFAKYHFLCPSARVSKMEVKPPSHLSPLDLVPANTGEPPYTIHYYGINGTIGNDVTVPEMHRLASPLTFEDTPVAGNGMIHWKFHIHFSDVVDGLANTMCVGEMSWDSPKFGTRYLSWLHGGTDGSYIAGCRNIAQPINTHKQRSVLIPFNNMPLGSSHIRGTNVGFGDGNIRFLSESMDFAVFQALATRNGHEQDVEVR